MSLSKIPVPLQFDALTAINWHGLRIISDGTDEGTYLLIDGKPMRGFNHVQWKIDPVKKTAEICLSLTDLTVSEEPIPLRALRALESVIASMPPFHCEEIDEEESVEIGLRKARQPRRDRVLRPSSQTAGE